ncbi:MAG: molybdopterin-binding protein, partial [Faecalibacillus sp.]
MEGIVKAVCISFKRGTEEENVQEAQFIKNYGIENDAHAGNWHRQVSLLSYDQVLKFKQRGAEIHDGSFGENLLVQGIDFKHLKVGTRLYCQDVILEMTQIGKECHSHCQIYQRMGECIMPHEGVFAKVIQGGIIKMGDKMYVKENGQQSLTAAVITLSDQGSKGLREDTSGKAIIDILKQNHYEIVEYFILPDDQNQLEQQLIRLADQRQVQLILTTGGTGFSPRDITPEATLNVMTRNAPGIAEAIRFESMKYTKRAMLSRGVSVIRHSTLIVNLPGSTKAVK